MALAAAVSDTTRVLCSYDYVIKNGAIYCEFVTAPSIFLAPIQMLTSILGVNEAPPTWIPGSLFVEARPTFIPGFL